MTQTDGPVSESYLMSESGESRRACCAVGVFSYDTGGNAS